MTTRPIAPTVPLSSATAPSATTVAGAPGGGAGGAGAATVRIPADLEAVRAALAADYDVLEELGRGGMAVVYRARERQLDREVAIKVLPFSVAFDAELVERFQREARTAARLEHPHIVPIYRVGQSGQVIYFAMKLLRGESLSARLARHGRLPAAEVQRILTETAGALGYAAAHGVVHRDVKPDNVMLDDEGRCVVTDFGIARSAADASLTATGMSIGTPRYMSPEQARGRGIDGRSDIYSLGVVGYECLTGRVPFEGDDAVAILVDHAQAKVPRPSLATDEERRLYAVIERMLAKKPADRYRSTDELFAALRSAGVGPAAGAAPSPASGGGAWAALDRIFDAGARLVREHGPRVEAGAAAAVAEGRRLARVHAPRLRAATRRLVDRAAPLVRRAVRRAGTWRPRVWAGVAGVALLSVVAYAALRLAPGQRSRCPAFLEPPGMVDEFGRPKPQPMALLVDAVGTVRRGAELDVRYDVCGLDEGTAFRTRVAVVRNGSRLRRFLRDGVSPVAVTFDGSASGPATRRRRTLDVSEMPPGSYTLLVVVIDATGRRREESVDFQIVGR